MGDIVELLSPKAMRQWRRALALERPEARVAVVPTMGALHAGHRRLMAEARREADVVVATLFVNPTQFGAGEDLDNYPQTYAADLAACREEGVDALFAPKVDEMYPGGHQTWVTVAEATQGLCGAGRPTHFRGVTTVVTMLFNLVQPQLAYFGKKDYQQWAVIRRMVRDLHQPVEIVGVETVREADGLAMSSRNAYLTPGERKRAVSLSAGLQTAAAAYRSGERDAEALLEAARGPLRAAEIAPEYLALREVGTLAPWTPPAPPVMLVAAAVGRARLIDNLELEAPAPPA